MKSSPQPYYCTTPHIDTTTGDRAERELSIKYDGNHYRMPLRDCFDADYVYLPDRLTVFIIGGWCHFNKHKPPRLSRILNWVIMASRPTTGVNINKRKARFKFEGSEYEVEDNAFCQRMFIIVPDANSTVVLPLRENGRAPTPSGGLSTEMTLGKGVTAPQPARLFE